MIRGAAWTVVAAIALELCAREVARRSIFELVIASRPGLGALVLLAAVTAALGMVAARRTARRGIPFLFAALFAAGVAAQLQLGARLQSDGFYYFSYLRSIAFDRDVEFSNDYRLLGLDDKPHLFEPTPTGYAQSAWTIGPAFVWAPFFAGGHAVATLLARTDPNVSTNGISFPYRQAICIAGLVYGLLGCWFMYRLMHLYFEARVAAGAVALTIGGSFMLWYLVKEPSMTHAPAMAGVAGFVWMWAATHGRRTPLQWALLGLIAGFITMIRWQNALFALLPASEALVALIGAARRRERDRLSAILTAGGLFTLCAVIGFLPQMLAWKSIYGSYLAVSPVGPQIRWWDPHVGDVLWSSRNGLLPWSPVLYLGAIGLVFLAVARPWLGVPALLTIAAMTFFNASIQDWWGSAGFGGRRFDGTIPLFALGLAAFLERAAAYARRHPLRLAGSGIGLLVLWNLTLMSAAQNGHVQIGEAISFGETGAHQARALHRWFGHPFTYPASLWFAARNDVPIGAYDLLDGHRFLGDPSRPYGRIDIGEPGDELWLEGGWHGPERSGPVSFRWAPESTAVRLPLARRARLAVQVRAQAFTYRGAAPQTLILAVNGSRQPAVAIPSEWGTAVVEVEEAAWRTGVNRLTLTFASAARPVDVGLGGDTRSLSAAVDYVRVQELPTR